MIWRALFWRLGVATIGAAAMAVPQCSAQQHPIVTVEPEVYVEVSAELDAWQPRAAEWLQTAADQWCEAGLACATVYVQGQAEPDYGRIIRVKLEPQQEPGKTAVGLAAINGNWIKIWQRLACRGEFCTPPSWIVPNHPACGTGADLGNRVRIDSVLAHELGHALGMQHVCSKRPQGGETRCTQEHAKLIMFPTQSACFYGEITTKGQP